MVYYEEEAMRLLQVEIVERLDPTEYVLDYLAQEEGLSDLVYKRILNAENRIEMNRMLVDVVKRKKIVQLFLKALEYKNSHANLAVALERKIVELRLSSFLNRNDVGKVPFPVVFEINDKMSKVTTKIEYFFKTVSHEGDLGKYERTLSLIRSKYGHLPDIQFCLLQVEIAKRRVFYEPSSEQNGILQGMEKVIPYTTNPHTNCMVFLARVGSTTAMSGELEQGLQYLNLARSKLVSIKPCKDTGMVLYIYINLLFELYEQHPTSETKKTIIRTISEAIDHFADECHILREDYTRMFYLKLVFCYLGIGVFCNRINCQVTEKDIQAAYSCLSAIKGMKGTFDKRRYMLYCVARSVFNQCRGISNRALELANEAERQAVLAGFKRELKSIRHLKYVLQDEAKLEERRTEQLESDLFRDLREMDGTALLTSYPKKMKSENRSSQRSKIVRHFGGFLVFLCRALIWPNGSYPATCLI